jgi:hypothetical protein
MWPWGHLAIGYVCYATYTRYWHDEHPAGLPVVALAFMTQLPDLIDKSLAYEVGVLPEGRSLAHSILIAVPACLLATWVAYRTEGWRARASVAGVVGYATHLFGDAVWSLLALEFDALTFLAWPLLAAPDYDTTSFGGHVEQFRTAVGALGSGAVSPFVVEWLLFALMLCLWAWHRLPPLASAVAALRGEDVAS